MSKSNLFGRFAVTTLAIGVPFCMQAHL